MQKDKVELTVGVLDIYGFEIFMVGVLPLCVCVCMCVCVCVFDGGLSSFCIWVEGLWWFGGEINGGGGGLGLVTLGSFSSFFI